MRTIHGDRWRRALAAAVACLFVQVPSPALSAETIAPFTTDGCSLFPDRSLMSSQDWCDCCVAHDLAYWRGGTAAERAEADRQLRNCVVQATGDTNLAELMYAGVRTGGGPYFLTPYRWGYGWPYGRGYQALSPEEDASVAAVGARYLRGGQPPSCPSAQVRR